MSTAWLAGAPLLLACGGGGDTRMAADTGLGAPSATAGTDTMAAAGQVAMTDAEVVGQVSASNGLEIATSQIAVQRARNSDVRQFARRMVDDHQKLQGEVDQLVTAQSLQPAAPVDTMAPEFAQARQALQDAPRGAAFDSTYMAMQVQSHQATLDQLNAAVSGAQNAQLRETLQGAIPVVQEHLDRAQEIQRELGGTAGDTARGATP